MTPTEAPPTPQAGDDPVCFLSAPEATDSAQRLYDEDVADVGYVMNLSRLWAYGPAEQEALFDLLGRASALGRLSFRQRAILVTACASTLGDSYCSLAWGDKLAEDAGPDFAATILSGGDDGLDGAEVALAHWARQVAHDPNATESGDVQLLRDAGFEDRQIFAITLFVALRLAFSTVNDALGARPDRQLAESVPGPVREAVSYGRSPADR